MTDMKRDEVTRKSITVSNEDGRITLHYENDVPFGVSIEAHGDKRTTAFNAGFFELMEYAVSIHKTRFEDD